MIITLKEYYLKHQDKDIKPEIETDEHISEKEKLSREKYLCRHCEHFITDGTLKYFIDGTWEHFFSNPAGKFFHIRTFVEAPGILRYGQYTSEYSWFKGLLWNYALCGHCNSHLGWHYQGPSNTMYGLIADELKQVVEEDDQ